MVIVIIAGLIIMYDGASCKAEYCFCMYANTTCLANNYANLICFSTPEYTSVECGYG
jgi:hypothetical protein